MGAGYGPGPVSLSLIHPGLPTYSKAEMSRGFHFACSVPAWRQPPRPRVCTRVPASQDLFYLRLVTFVIYAIIYLVENGNHFLQEVNMTKNFTAVIKNLSERKAVCWKRSNMFKGTPEGDAAVERLAVIEAAIERNLAEAADELAGLIG